MVGPGTGIAPMRAFLQERRFQREQETVVGKSVLYFGCRNSNEDFIYREELQGYQADGTLDVLYTAFSREQAEKVYVQHRLRYDARPSPPSPFYWLKSLVRHIPRLTTVFAAAVTVAVAVVAPD